MPPPRATDYHALFDLISRRDFLCTLSAVAASTSAGCSRMGTSLFPRIGELLETHQHDIDAMLREALEHEKNGIRLYRELLELVQSHDIRLEEYARSMILSEEDHVDELGKMLR